ncbi:cell division protein ZapA [Weissella tructae]|uniref:Cell division protein ZapA n=2 Tax=Weissella TaxID=46255 RepID=A0A075TUW5_9LACO|nr:MULTISPECIES: cell division protein ZapA [Weissella]AIG65359.1 Cell division protein ZapA [Weissella tructae]AIM62673.1 Cell division protein ZapA [Weissella ceti]AIM64008.1 Cell division protein ZapA [Weissella ceti]ELA07181.1 cell-division Z-ring protein [Weissella ceti NC36]QVV91740.1 cell division protein ZapA [Weissella tructae]
MNKTRYKGMILGEEVVISGTKGETHMDAVFEIVNKQLKELAHMNENLTREQMLTLMAINAVSDQVTMQAEMDAEK